jgi:hypothetical protein
LKRPVVIEELRRSDAGARMPVHEAYQPVQQTRNSRHIRIKQQGVAAPPERTQARVGIRGETQRHPVAVDDDLRIPRRYPIRSPVGASIVD